MLAVAFPADNIDWGGIHWNPSFLHTGGDHSEARRCFDCSGQKTPIPCCPQARLPLPKE